MIDESFRRDLAGRIADALADRLATAGDEAVATDDLDRLRRLFADGEISRERLMHGLSAALRNSALSEALHDRVLEEGEELSSTALRLVDNLPADESAGDEAGDSAYRSSAVLVPATVDLDSIPSSGWRRVTGKDLISLLWQIGPVDGVIRVTPDSTICHVRRLPWYDSVGLIRLTDPTWANKTLALYYLIMDERLYRLNGASPPIHEINAKAPIRLSERNAADYLRFFCFFVNGEEGPFYLAEDVSDPFLPQFDAPELQELFSSTLRPVQYEGRNESGHFLYQAVVYYSNALFIGDFAVHSSGMIEMLDDEPIAASLPGRVVAPLTGPA